DFLHLFTGAVVNAHLACRHDFTHCVSALAHNQRVRPIHEDRETVGAWMFRDEPVTQVDAEQVGVGRDRQSVRVVPRMATPGTAGSCMSHGESWNATVTPAKDRAARDSGLPGDLTIVESFLDES